MEKAEDAVELNSRVTDELAAIGLELARKEGIPTGSNMKMRKESGRVVEVRNEDSSTLAKLVGS